MCRFLSIHGSDHYVLFCHDPLSRLDNMQLSYASPWVDPWDNLRNPGWNSTVWYFVPRRGGVTWIFPLYDTIKKTTVQTRNTPRLSNTTSLIVRIHKRLNTFERERKKNYFLLNYLII